MAVVEALVMYIGRTEIEDPGEYETNQTERLRKYALRVESAGYMS